MTPRLKELAERFETELKDKYTLNVDTDIFVASLLKISTRSKYGYKTEWAFRFKNVAQIEKYVEECLNKKINSEINSKNAKVERLVKRNNGIASVQVGDIFNDSWGYEQTNQDFFIVVGRPSKTTAIVQKVGYDSIETTSWCSENVKVNTALIIGEPKKVTLTGASFKVNSFSSAYKVEDKERLFHRSWGY